MLTHELSVLVTSSSEALVSSVCIGLNGQKVWRRERTVRAFEAMPWLAAHSCCVYRYAVRFESLSPELLRPTRLY